MEPTCRSRASSRRARGDRAADGIRHGARARAAQRRSRARPRNAYRAAACDNHAVQRARELSRRRLPPGHGGRRSEAGEGGPRSVAGASTIADLFAGLGTFALATEAAYAAEASRDAAAALKRAAPAVAVEHRDLYRRPLDAKELRALRCASSSIRRAPARPSRCAGAVSVSGSPMSAAIRRHSHATPRCWRTAATRSMGAARRPVPLVDPCRARRLLHP